MVYPILFKNFWPLAKLSSSWRRERKVPKFLRGNFRRHLILKLFEVQIRSSQHGESKRLKRQRGSSTAFFCQEILANRPFIFWPSLVVRIMQKKHHRWNYVLRDKLRTRLTSGEWYSMMKGDFKIKWPINSIQIFFPGPEN